MPGVLLDTHAAVWYLARSTQLSVSARQAIVDALAAGAPVYVALISLVELRPLVERRRLPAQAFDSLDEALIDPDVALEPVPLDQRVARMVSSVARHEVPDMPDRIIAATALALNVPLVTKDHRIRSAAVHTIW